MDEKNRLFTELIFGSKSCSIMSGSSDAQDAVNGIIFQIRPSFIKEFLESDRQKYPKKEHIIEKLFTISGIWSQSIKIKSCSD